MWGWALRGWAAWGLGSVGSGKLDSVCVGQGGAGSGFGEFLVLGQCWAERVVGLLLLLAAHLWMSPHG